MTDTKPLVVFVHIPRTGGTTLWSVLNAAYPAGRVRRVIEGGNQQVQQAALDLMADGAPGLDVLGGHFRYGVHKGCPRDVQYMTLLRDPTDMLLSRYYKILRKPEKRRHAEFSGGDVDESEALRQMARNSQTAKLAGLPLGTPVLPEHLDQARKNLESFAVVGLMDRFDETLMLMKHVFGWKRYPYYERLNAGSNRPSSIVQDVYQLGRELNPLDYALYDFATALFEQRIAEAGLGLKRTIWSFRLRQALRSRFRKAPAQQPLHDTDEKEDSDG